MERVDNFLGNEFIFSPRFRIWRHVIYWSLHITIWTLFWIVVGTPVTFGRQLLNLAMWIPAFILFSYPLVYGAIPLLLKGKISAFFLAVLTWGVAGLFIDELYRSYILIPAQEALGLTMILPRGPLAFCYLCMTTSAASPMIIKFYKLCTQKQQEWVQAQKEKTTAELQLLKAQVQPHFLFNTLNNIYSFSLDNSPKTPGLILKLSLLMSYMIQECDTKEVSIGKELQIMKNYIDLERERYGNRLDISFHVTGDITDKMIAPLLLLPFLENAFKHGISQQITRHWLSVDVRIKSDMLHCKIMNSKNDHVAYRENGIGIANVKKRLQVLYPDNHELKTKDEGNYFAVWMTVKLAGITPSILESSVQVSNNRLIAHEDLQPAYQ